MWCKVPLYQEIKKIQGVTIYTLLITSYPQGCLLGMPIFLRRKPLPLERIKASNIMIYN